MRQVFARRIAVVLLVVFTVLPAAAAPRGDDGQPGLLDRVVRFVQHLKHLLPLPLDTIDATVPKP